MLLIYFPLFYLWAILLQPLSYLWITLMNDTYFSKKHFMIH